MALSSPEAKYVNFKYSVLGPDDYKTNKVKHLWFSKTNVKGTCLPGADPLCLNEGLIPNQVSTPHLSF